MRITSSSLPRACLLATAWLFAAAAFAQASVSVSDVTTPTADTFGINRKSETSPAVSWKGSSPGSIESMLLTLPSPIQLEPQKELLIHLLSLPVYPAEHDAIPHEWLALRLEALHTIGADDAAANLAAAVPSALSLSDRARRAGVDALLRTGRIKEACRLALPVVETEAGSALFWAERVTFCHYMKGDTPQAELSWQLAQEVHGRQIPVLAKSLLTQWKSTTALPPLTRAEVEIEPLLTAAILKDEKTGVVNRIPADFITSEGVFTVSPALAAALTQVEALPPIIHFELMEKAASYGLGNPAALRAEYNKLASDVTMWDKLPPEANLRLQAVYRLRNIPENSTQMAELERAIPLFSQKFGDAFTYRFFADQMELLHEALETLQPSASLSMEAAADDVMNRNTEGAERIARYLDTQQALPDHKAAAYAIRLAIRLQQGEAPSTLDLNQLPSEAQDSWITARTAKVLEGLGTQVAYPERQIVGSAPLMSPPPSNIMDRLRTAKANGLEAETLLASALLLPSGSLRQVSNQTAFEIVDNLRRHGFTTLARTFAIQFLLHAPLTPQ